METTEPLGHHSITQEEEIQGLQGAIAIPEIILQKIWLRSDFFHNKLKTYSGKKLQIINPGRWNRFEGPDFKEAEIIIDGQRLVGDIEIHFHPNDWFNHGHSYNPNFANVILHVTLFEPIPEHPPIFTTLGFCPETFVLLPYLRQGLEEYVLEEALLTMENRDNTEFLQALLNKQETEIKHLLLEKAQLRWKQKYTFALYRLKIDNWDDVCHQMVLETLGYRRNRATMNLIAIKYPLRAIAQGQHTAAELFASQEGNWKLAKLRQANHPKKRLAQYLHLVKQNPQWPTHWLKKAESLSFQQSISSTSMYRKHYQLSKLASLIQEEIFSSMISSTRFHTLVVDALLPLASAYLNKDLFHLWFHWYPGDMPSAVPSFLNPTNIINKGQPSCNGLNQAILQLFIETRLI